MKWYFAMESVGCKKYLPYIRAAVISCRERTTLTPICLWYDRNKDIPEDIAGFFNKYDVKLIHHEARVYRTALQQAIDVTHFTSGIFLRFDIPLIEKQDQYVLYTDCDVMFMSDVDLSGLKPRFFAAAPEFVKDYWGYFNSGVMVMNIEEMRRTSTELLIATIARFRSGFGVGHDQNDLNSFYFDNWDRLPLEYNWKPYWGVSAEAVIVHFHGPKPDDFWLTINGVKNDDLALRMISLDYEGYAQYTMEFLQILGNAGYPMERPDGLIRT